MPCYDPQHEIEQDNNREKARKFDGVSKENQILQKENNFLTAGLCAIITELENRGLASEILPIASRHGLVDLMDFWNTHRNEDETRLRNALHKFSIHEQEVLRRLLNKE